MKNSFVKRFKTNSLHDKNQVFKQEVDTSDLEVRIKEVENENADLRARLEKVADAASEAHEKLANDNQQMKKALETEKKNYKAAELKIAEFREELLNVKSERRKLSESLKVERQNGEAFEKELNVFKELKVNLEASVNYKDKQLTLKINDLKGPERKMILSII